MKAYVWAVAGQMRTAALCTITARKPMQAPDPAGGGFCGGDAFPRQPRLGEKQRRPGCSASSRRLGYLLPVPFLSRSTRHLSGSSAAARGAVLTSQHLLQFQAALKMSIREGPCPAPSLSLCLSCAPRCHRPPRQRRFSGQWLPVHPRHTSRSRGGENMGGFYLSQA